MANKTIISVDCVIPGDFSEFVTFDSNTSLLDAYIILFNPSLADFYFSSKTFQGKTSLDETRSFHLREVANHWRRELKEALLAGKTIFIFLNDLKDVFIDTGRREYSGTGRSRRTTEIVEEFNNYCILPGVSVTRSHGKEMMLTRSGEILSDYWREFREYSLYKVLIEGNIGEPLVITKSGAKVVSSLIRNKESGGTLVLLPFLNMWEETFDEEKETDEGFEMVWTTEGISFGKKLCNCLLEIDETLRSACAITPAPDWAKISDYSLPQEAKLLQDLVAIEAELESLENRKEQLKSHLLKENLPRRLLYEKGKPLEIAVLQALSLIGFSATSYQDDDSEFDVIFKCTEGRFIGEVEGRDSKAINIDKLRQLEMNIHEDFERDEVSEMAKGVLFGNAYRLKPLNERRKFFTDKCMKAAARNGTALVRTPDLFKIVQYLSGIDDYQFARQCREKIFSTVGRVVEFPEPPISKNIQDEVQQSNTEDENTRSD
ncbi:MAG: hypothetical protein GY774_20140 [Planctomycetes bacterium]|nr:hypothetical protein [Planctomycetota bacterium]